MLHPSAPWEESVTWRGAAGKDVPESGRYYNKGMRIDLFMIQGGLKDRVDTTEVCGRGANMEGFLGSDHSPVLLRLFPGEAAGSAAPSTANVGLLSCDASIQSVPPEQHRRRRLR